jgi:flagellar hook-associated protein 2
VVNNRITFGGLASGIDTNSIIDQLVAVQRRPISLMQSKQLKVRSKADALTRVSSALTSLTSRATSLTAPDTFRQRSASVLAKTEDANKVAATATTGAAAGSFTFHVTALASQTRLESTTAVGEAVDAGAPLTDAGFGLALTAGTFTINGTVFTIAAATAESVASASSVGGAFDPNVPLDASGGDITTAGGSFTINGTTINFSAETDKIADVIGYINASAAGVTASFDEGTGLFTLTHKTTGTGQTITLADVTGNFLESMKLIDGGGGTLGTQTAGTDVMSLNDVIGDINTAGIGVTATLVTDAAGRLNALELTSGAAVQLGSGADTSNFLAMTSLLESPPGSTRTSQRGLAGVSRSADLVDARFATPLSQNTGTFKVNGVEISYDGTSESLSNIMSKINTSDAGVPVTYDGFTDRLKVTSDSTGPLAVTFEDVDGNFLAASGLLAASQTMGANAAYSIDGGPTRYATSNTVTDAVDGVTLTLTGLTTEAVKVQVNLQPNNVVTAVEAFVADFNKVLDTIDAYTVYREGGNSGVLFGDSTVRGIEQALRGVLARSVSGLSGGLRTPADIGLSFGAVGTGVGDAKRLVLDSAKLSEVARRDPEAVTALFTTFTGTAALTPGGTGSVDSISGVPTEAKKAGRYAIASDGAGVLSVTFTPNDGSASSSVSASVTAGGTNTTLIPGVTITATNPLQAGTNEIIIGASREGFAKSFSEYLSAITRTGGALSSRSSEMSKQISEIDRQIERLEDRVSKREQELVRRFTQMELAIARVQQQSQSLSQMQAQLGGLNQS